MKDYNARIPFQLFVWCVLSGMHEKLLTDLWVVIFSCCNKIWLKCSCNRVSNTWNKQEKKTINLQKLRDGIHLRGIIVGNKLHLFILHFNVCMVTQFRLAGNTGDFGFFFGVKHFKYTKPWLIQSETSNRSNSLVGDLQARVWKVLVNHVLVQRWSAVVQTKHLVIVVHNAAWSASSKWKRNAVGVLGTVKARLKKHVLPHSVGERWVHVLW